MRYSANHHYGELVKDIVGVTYLDNKHFLIYYIKLKKYYINNIKIWKSRLIRDIIIKYSLYYINNIKIWINRLIRDIIIKYSLYKSYKD